ncbi:MAG: AAA family ATPase [Blastocatellia bacterium]|nr:AAA family ATPase [Blastocatellia bacterium]
MRIRKLNLKNIGPFEDGEIEFKPSEGTQEIHIFTGPNGSGKTTLLQALAIFFGSPPQNVEALLKRMRSDYSSKIKITLEDAEWSKPPGFSVNRLDLVHTIERYSHSYYGAVEFSKLPYLPEYASTNKKENWLPFAYNGYRVARSIPINAIQEIETGAWYDVFSEALIFDKRVLEKPNAFTINQWIANSISKRAISKEKGKEKEASKYESALKTLEQVISKIVGYKIEFDLQTTPLSLVAKSQNSELEFDVLPDGLRSTISWIGDLLMRLDFFDSLRIDSPDWDQSSPINQRRLFLFLDEIEVHLHPSWQRNILPVVKEFFPNATIFLTTHSPFVVNSVDGAWVYDLGLKDGKAFLEKTRLSKTGESYEYILRDIFDIDTRFGVEAQKDLDLFQQLKNELLQGKPIEEEDFLTLARRLATQSLELQSIIQFELRQLNRIKGKSYEI